MLDSAFLESFDAVMKILGPAFLAALMLAMGGLHCPAVEPSVVLPLWPGTAPGEKDSVGEEQDQTKPADNLIAGKKLIRLGNVSKPTIALYQPAAEKRNGTTVVVCPGGGYHILAMDLEGTEVCEWLNSIGVSAVLLKYRVPERSGLEKHAAAFQDAQRALGLVRHHATEWGLNPNRIGILCFSAGGHLAALASNRCDPRSYPAIDAADSISCRPDFTVLIYPAYLTIKEDNDRVSPDLNLTTNTPPCFIAMAQDDPIRVETALFYAAGLKKLNVPFELHIYPTGGHGYGLRPTKDLVTTWPQRATDWMRNCGLLGSN